MKSTQDLYKRFLKAKARRDSLESTWRECYAFSLPQREGVFSETVSQTDTLFDGTAPDSVDQLAASMLSELTPAWNRWFDLSVGADLYGEEARQAAQTLENISNIMQGHFDRSSFVVELHQCFLDLVTVGTACLLFEEEKIGGASAFKFTAVPLSELYVEEGRSGRLDVTFRNHTMTLEEIQNRFVQNKLPPALIEKLKDKDAKANVIEAVVPGDKGGYDYQVFVCEGADDFTVLKEGHFTESPFITFRWLKAPGETYGRSPVMKALPDIKTANKVVELILKNASISVTGIWQADDDGVLNPANIKLVPGAIIPKAVGSKGLTALEAPGKFDVSQLVLEDLRKRINHALLADRLAEINTPSMTATEVLERSAEIARILGASFGRLQSELLTPLLKRAFCILRRRGDVMNFDLDGKIVDLQYKSPLAMSQARKDVSNVTEWITQAAMLGADGQAAVNMFEAAKWLGHTLNVPASLIVENKPDTETGLAELASLVTGETTQNVGTL